MERRFDMSDFEQSLKDHADQFRMTPSKRVWNGIYNNLHPGSKWPSLTVAVVFIIALVTVGTLNNSSRHLQSSANSTSSPVSNELKAGKKAKSGESLAFENKGRAKSSNVDESNISSSSLKNKVSSTEAEVASLNKPAQNSTITSISSSTKISSELNAVQKGEVHSSGKKVSVATKVNEANIYQQTQIDQSVFNATVNEQLSSIPVLQQHLTDRPLSFAVADLNDLYNSNILIPVSFNSQSLSPSAAILINNDLLNKAALLKFIGDHENSLTENTSATALRLHKKRKYSINWTYYVNPTISTVSINKKTVQPENNTSSLLVLSGEPSFKLIHNPRLGLEAGAQMNVHVAPKLDLVTGLNLSYSGYNNISNLVHPTFTTLNLNDNKGGTYSKTYITHYGNGQSQDHINLTNYSIAASIPFGFEYNLYKGSNIKIDLSTLLEPTVIIRDDAFLMSSDGRYYVNDPLMVRRVNLDGHFGTYITFGNKLKWHMGPDFRYQLLSTYKNIYPIKEHLIDYGIRIGISK
ncbi:MAG: hypothetical protein ACTHK8_15715 [Ginsengibacter sp.]